MMQQHDLNWFMNMAIENANLAIGRGEVPVGAVVVSPDGRALSQAFNEKEYEFDACGHAEIVAIRRAGAVIKNWRLSGCTLFVTLEPCPMCLAAMVHARIERVVFGAYDKKGGAFSLGYNLYKDERLNHQFSVLGGIEHYRCSRLLSEFFKKRRDGHNNF